MAFILQEHPMATQNIYTANVQRLVEIKQTDPHFFAHLQDIAGLLQKDAGKYVDDWESGHEYFGPTVEHVLICQQYRPVYPSCEEHKLAVAPEKSILNDEKEYEFSWAAKSLAGKSSYQCRNKLYLGSDGELHVTTMAPGIHTLSADELQDLTEGKLVSYRCFTEGLAKGIYEEHTTFSLPREVFVETWV